MKHRKIWTDQDRALLLKMKGERIPGKHIAAHFGVSVRAIDIQYERIRHPEFRLKRKLVRQYKDRPGIKGTWRPKPMGSLRSGDRWTKEENQTLLTRGDKGDEFGEIGTTLNRSRWACKVQYNALKRGSAKSPSEDQRFKTSRETIDLRIRETLANRPQYESLTAAFFGDPLPGRSALDQIATHSDERQFAPDKRYSDFRPSITLATEPLR
jgi:hypothetical protein